MVIQVLPKDPDNELDVRRCKLFERFLNAEIERAIEAQRTDPAAVPWWRQGDEGSQD